MQAPGNAGYLPAKADDRKTPSGLNSWTDWSDFHLHRATPLSNWNLTLSHLVAIGPPAWINLAYRQVCRINLKIFPRHDRCERRLRAPFSGRPEPRVSSPASLRCKPGSAAAGGNAAWPEARPLREIPIPDFY